MRPAPQRQGSSRDRRKPDRLADEPAPGLLKHQREFGQAEIEAIHRARNEHAKPPEFPRLPQPCRREARILPRKPRATFGPAAAMNLAALSRNRACSDVRCSSMARSHRPSTWKVQDAAGEDVALDFR